MIFEYLRNVFDLKDYISNFIQLLQLSSHIATRLFPKFIVRVFNYVRLLALAKPLGGIKPIAMGKVFYWSINITLCFNSKIVPFSFVVHWFGMVVKGGCEAMVHDIQSVLDVHLNWVVLQMDVVKVFNSILHKAIF